MPDRLPLSHQLTGVEILALTLCYGGVSDGDRLSESVPAATWDALFQRGFLRLSRDITGEGVTVVTHDGASALLGVTRAA